MQTVENVFTAKTVEEAIEKGLTALGISKEQASITILEEPKKKFLFGYTPAKVKVEAKKSDGTRAVEFIDGLLEIMGNNGVGVLKSDDEKIEIEIQTTNSHAVIGRRGEVLDAIQCMAGAVANIGNDDYKKIVVDCENYRAQREETLIALANKLAKKAVEKGKKVILEPMNPYERRIIHAALSNSEEVKTTSDGREPNRYVVIIPNNLKPFEKRDRKPYGDRKGRREFGDGEKGERRDRRDRRDRGDRGDRGARPPKAKKELNFGTVFLGNSRNNQPAENKENKNNEE